MCIKSGRAAVTRVKSLIKQLSLKYVFSYLFFWLILLQVTTFIIDVAKM